MIKSLSLISLATGVILTSIAAPSMANESDTHHRQSYNYSQFSYVQPHRGSEDPHYVYTQPQRSYSGQHQTYSQPYQPYLEQHQGHAHS
jgi:hypothetical protein